MTTLKFCQVLAALTFTGLAVIAQLTAQTAPAKRAGDVVTMSKFEGKDVPIAQKILTTAWPFINGRRVVVQGRLTTVDLPVLVEKTNRLAARLVGERSGLQVAF